MAKEAEVETLSHHPGGKPHITSERHDVLYSKARYVLHQRHIKRPWFNLNPFLEKTDETIDLDNFLPEESKYIQRLESLVLCETYTSDLPLDTRELALGVFFEYLNSDLWKDGCSIRVLEGQLLDQLLISLYRLEKENIAIRHTTYAFARNKRPITGCYKLADKESYGIREETLLIEFAYFGRLTKGQPNKKSQNPLEYLHDEGVAEYSCDDVFHKVPVLPPLQQKSSTTQAKKQSLSQSIHMDQLPNANLPDQNKGNIPKWGRRGSLMSKHVTAIDFLNTLDSTNRRKSIAVVPTTMSKYGTPLETLQTFTGPQEKRRESVVRIVEEPKPQRRLSTVVDRLIVPSKQRRLSLAQTTYHSESEDGSPLVPDVPDTEDEEDTREVEDKGLYGHEFYLSDTRNESSKTHKESTKLKLQRKKQERLRRRMAYKDEQDEIARYKKKGGLPPLPPLDLEDLQRNATMHHTIKLPDTLPTFEEFAKLLKEDEYYDPRYRNKVRLKSKIIKKRYFIAKGLDQPNIKVQLDPIPNEMKNTGLTKTASRRASVTDTQTLKGSKGCLLPPLKITKPTDAPSNVSMRFAEEVHGVTDSGPCKEHCLRSNVSFSQKREEKAGNLLHANANTQKKKSQVKITPSRSFLKPKDGKADNLTRPSVKNVTKRSTVKLAPPGPNVTLKPSVSLRTGRTSAIIQNVNLHDDDSESPDSDTDASDTEVETPCLFDGTKLNVRYSVERLKKKRRLKKKKPAFMDILSKYCNTHQALKAFRKVPATREERTVREIIRRMGRGKKRNVNGQQEHEVVIGKLRKFPFNDAKPRKRLTLESLSRGEFSKPDLTTFHEDVRKAMDKFVIRREIVVSDKQTFNRSATSVTFTKMSCYKKKHVDG